MPLPTATPSKIAPLLLHGGDEAFARILQRIVNAKHSIVMRCFDWRDDETGQMVAEAMLSAAERGVQITIYKDLVGSHYEYFEGNRQSFFHKNIGLFGRVQNLALMTAYSQLASMRQSASSLADALLNHPNITVLRHAKLFDHAKVCVFDNEVIILGGMGVGDDFRLHNVDFMVELCEPHVVARYIARCHGDVEFDPTRQLDFLLHSRDVNGSDASKLLLQRLSLIDSAASRLTVEMAYLGDPRFTDALVRAVHRGVEVTLITASKANVLADMNRGTCNQLLRLTRGAANLRIALHPRMVHSKVTIIDRKIVEIGSQLPPSPMVFTMRWMSTCKTQTLRPSLRQNSKIILCRVSC
ncbi:MAG: phosphatidylserine/phosphatidylglycerophosphate/cardiolipin synthase family protein [Myxococcota bacterium]